MADKEGYGFLFPIKKDQRKENGPIMSGKATINGRVVKLAAWPKSSKNGTGYLSLKVEDETEATEQVQIEGVDEAATG